MATFNEKTTDLETSMVDVDGSTSEVDDRSTSDGDHQSTFEGDHQSTRHLDRPMVGNQNRSITDKENRSTLVTDSDRLPYRRDVLPLILEKGVRGTVVTINKLKHFGFIKRRDRIDYQDLFVRNASINGHIRQKKLFVGDTCKFDIMKTNRGVEAVNVDIIDRASNEISRLPKIPKKNQTVEDNKVSGDLFKSTITDLFREVLRKT